jgi:hypothetical protein
VIFLKKEKASLRWVVYSLNRVDQTQLSQKQTKTLAFRPLYQSGPHNPQSNKRPVIVNFERVRKLNLVLPN